MKISIIIICLIGLSGVCYGMLNNNDIVFIAGILIITAGYIMIRKRLKDKTGKKD
jgi:inner membrane protein involved in colicin E2 resistance